ncbi:flagellin N-terminal helical domain-containing protein [Desulfolucanica intricata]|uniref:flagellin N-terminal helical domain-containing protein n=1 Tax=Desulfolucanica intricata TaxID=1285191 RepID=UPI0008371223|nr:flagellin [Desulfolucanica intricata]
MRINHNIAALNTYRQLTMGTNAAQKNMSKLSSGMRINNAADDAAGLAISEKMRNQIRGLEQAQRNAQDAISLIQTAEGSLSEIHSILGRMKELATQASNDTYSAQDRVNMQDEMTQLTTEIDRIRNTTDFNTKNLLDGSMGKAVSTAVANISGNTSLRTTNASTAITTGTALTDLLDSDGNSLGITAEDTVTISYVIDGTTKEYTFTVGNNTIATLETTDGTTANTDLTVDMNATDTTQLEVKAATEGFAGAINGFTVTVKDSDGNIKTAATNALSAFTETTAAADVRADGRASFQVGHMTGQNIQLDINDMGAAALGVKDLKITTQSQADIAIKVIDNASAKVSSERSKLGAYQNRLEYTINNLGTSSENLTAAESRIRDVDMAKEMMEFTKNNILNQAAQAMLAQANQQPQAVLQLLR